MPTTDGVASLYGALRRFDRKERRAVIGQALGQAGLDQGFCTKISDCAQIEPPLQAGATGWFTDCHLDWLAGALSLYAQGEDRCLEPVLNDGEIGERLVHGNQEDIDLLLVRGTDLILIEAKWFGAWNMKQLRRKLQRLRLLRKHADEVCQRAGRDPIKTHLVLMSPSKPPNAVQVLWEGHEAGTSLRWLKMQPPDGRTDAFAVTRCDAVGKPAHDGSFWRTTKVKLPK